MSPKDSAERDYLGLSFLSRSFRVTNLNTQMAIIEIFNMYCPYCQAEAPNVNLLYEKINANRSLKGKIKIIGIGVGNTTFEVGVFKNKYHVPFPLFPDDDLKIHKLMGEVRTPFFIVVKLNGDGKHEVIFSKPGALGPVDPFLAEMITRSGLK
jgi:peroxiredoxin